MPRRQTIYVEGFGHTNPIPAACRVGPLLMSGLILGLDPATGKVAPTLEGQCALMFRHLRSIVEAGGGSTADIVKLDVWMVDRSRRDALNNEWLAMFPDPQDRPARQTMQADLTGGVLIQCAVTAMIGS